MSHVVTIVCDFCDTSFTINDSIMDMPPYWLGLRIIIADKDGLVPPHEREDLIDLHFCGDKCASEYFLSDEFKSRRLMVDKPDDMDEGDVE